MIRRMVRPLKALGRDCTAGLLDGVVAESFAAQP
jgi:hypothetical protein